MTSFLDFLVSIIGDSRLDIGVIKAQGLAALVLAMGVVLLLLYRALKG